MGTAATHDRPSPARTIRNLPRMLRLSWRLLWDPGISRWSKLIPGLALAYLISPADILPDALPGLGQLDDATILLAALWAFVRTCPPDIVRAHGGASEPTPDATGPRG